MLEEIDWKLILLDHSPMQKSLVGQGKLWKEFLYVNENRISNDNNNNEKFIEN